MAGPCALSSRLLTLEDALDVEDDDEPDDDDDDDRDPPLERESELYDLDRRLREERDDEAFLGLREDGDWLPEALRLRLRERDPE